MDALTVIRRLGNGKLIDDLAEQLAEVAARVVETGKPGAVTVTLKVSNREPGDVMVVVQDTVKRTLPVKPARGTYLYAVDEGLHDRDPRQTVMEFTVIESGKPEIREAAEAPAAVREG